MDKTTKHSFFGINGYSAAIAVVALSGFLSACSLAPTYERPDLDLPKTEQVSAEQAEQQQQAMVSWWQRFNDPVLNELIEKALNQNLDIALQAARIEQARAELGLSKTEFYPTLNGQAQAERKKASYDGTPQLSPGQDRYSTNYSVAATLGYELNLFSALSGKEVAKAQLLSAAYSHDAIRLAVVGDIVANYMSLRDVQRQMRITQETIDSREDDLGLAQKKYQSGAISRLELLQKQALVASAKSQLPELVQRLNELESSLSLLTGESPRKIMAQRGIKPGSFDDIHLPKDLPEVLPSALINRRPDIRAAEADLAAANAKIGEARAQYFPTINLTGLLGSSAAHTGDLFHSSSSMGSISGGISLPIFSFGRIKGQVDTAKSKKEQATIQYRQVVRQAFKEVRDALTGINISKAREQADRDQVEAYQDTYELAQNRYDAGRISLQEVLDAQRQLLSAQTKLSDTIRDRYVATANLFKALGGGWESDEDSIEKNIDVGLPQPDDDDNKSES